MDPVGHVHERRAARARLDRGDDAEPADVLRAEAGRIALHVFVDRLLRAFGEVVLVGERLVGLREAVLAGAAASDQQEQTASGG